MKYLYWFGGIVCISISAFGYYYILGTEPMRFGAQEIPEDVDILRLSIGFLVTLLGVFIGVTYGLLQKLKKEGHAQIDSFKAFSLKIFYSTDLWIGFCGAPLVFALLMQSTQGATWPGLIAVALQNGFCCAIIADRFIAQNNA